MFIYVSGQFVILMLWVCLGGILEFTSVKATAPKLAKIRFKGTYWNAFSYELVLVLNRNFCAESVGNKHVFSFKWILATWAEEATARSASAPHFH